MTSVKIDLTPEGLNINIFDRAHKPVFNPELPLISQSTGRGFFSTLAWEISRYKTFRIEVEGHTASKVEGRDERITLCGICPPDRANAARRRLVANGVTEKQISKVSGFADIAPMPGYEPTNEVNRRVTVLLKLKDSVNALSDHPDAAKPDQRPDDNTAN